ncbi:Metabotropic glutamate receptor 4 [Mactra antiquata]
MNGTLIPNTPIAVDFWKIRECPQARIFFLTHLHGDHVTGLTSSWRYPIYCSEITKQLLIHNFEIDKSLINILEIDVTKKIYLDRVHNEQMSVTAIDANHCPGAIMILMEGYFGTILHTGDFRFYSHMITDTPLSRYSGKIDTLYLDNTYCTPSCSFPSKETAEKQVIDIIQQYPNRDILIAMRNLGKETLLYSIALHFQEWISVNGKFYERLQIFEAPNVFDYSSAQRIRVITFHKVSNKFDEHVNEKHPTIVILPTALYCGIDARPYENNKNVFVVLYSDHSSYSEIVEFVSFLKPQKIIPIVKASSRGPFGCSVANRADMLQLVEFTSKSNEASNVVVPDSVKLFMNGCLSFGAAANNKKTKKKRKKKNRTKVVNKGVIYDSSNSELEDTVEIINDENLSVKDTNGCIDENDLMELPDIEVVQNEKFTEAKKYKFARCSKSICFS